MEKIKKIDMKHNKIFLDHLRSKDWEELVKFAKNNQTMILNQIQNISTIIEIKDIDDSLFDIKKKTSTYEFSFKLQFILHIFQIYNGSKLNIEKIVFNLIIKQIQNISKTDITFFVKSFPKTRFFPIQESLADIFNYLYVLIDIYPDEMVQNLSLLKEKKKWYLIHRLYDHDNNLTDKDTDLFKEFVKAKMINLKQIQNFTKNYSDQLKSDVREIINQKKQTFLSRLFPFTSEKFFELSKTHWGWFDHFLYVFNDDEINLILQNIITIPHKFKHSNKINIGNLIHNILISVVWNGKGELIWQYRKKILKNDHKQPISDFLVRNPKFIQEISDIPKFIKKLGFFAKNLLIEKFIPYTNFNIETFKAFLTSNVRIGEIFKFFKENFPENNAEYDSILITQIKNVKCFVNNCIPLYNIVFSGYNQNWSHRKYFPKISFDLLLAKVTDYLDFLKLLKKKPNYNMLDSNQIYSNFNKFSFEIQKRIIDSSLPNNISILLHLVYKIKLSQKIILKILKSLRFNTTSNQKLLILKVFLQKYSLNEQKMNLIYNLLDICSDLPLKAQVYSYLGRHTQAINIWEKILPNQQNLKFYITEKIAYLGDLMNLEPKFEFSIMSKYNKEFKKLQSEFHEIEDLTNKESTILNFKIEFYQIQTYINYIFNEISANERILDVSKLKEKNKSIKQLKQLNVPDVEKKYLELITKIIELLKESINKSPQNILSFIQRNISTEKLANIRDIRYKNFIKKITDCNQFIDLSSIRAPNLINFCPTISNIKDIIYYKKELNYEENEENKELTTKLWKYSDRKNTPFFLDISESFKEIYILIITQNPTMIKPKVKYFPPQITTLYLDEKSNNINQSSREKREFLYKFEIKGEKFIGTRNFEMKFYEPNLCRISKKCLIKIQYNSNELNTLEFVISTLENSFDLLLNNYKSFRNKENSITNILKIAIKGPLNDRGLEVHFLSPGGESEAGKEQGQRDLVILSSDHKELVILEALRITRKNEDSVIIKHFRKIFNYDKVGLSTLIFLCYVKRELNLEKIWTNYKELVKEFNWKYPFTPNFKDLSYNLGYHIKKGISNHHIENNNRNISIYHYLLHGFDF